MVYLVRNKDDLDQQLALAEDKLVVIDFYANWGVEIEDNQLVVRRLDPLVVVVHGADRSHFHGFTEEITGFKGVI